MSLKELFWKEGKIELANKKVLINKCQCYINKYFTKLTKNRKDGWYCKKYDWHCLAKLEFINKQKISYNLWFLTLQCQNSHQIIKKLIFKKNKWKTINIKNYKREIIWLKITLKLWKDLKLSEKTKPFQLKEIEYINFNKEYFYDIKNNKKEMKENKTNKFANLTTEEIRTNIDNLKIQLTEYEKTNYKSIQDKTMTNLLLQKIKNLEIEVIKRQETNNYSEKE